LKTGDTLCSPSHPIALESHHFPEPVISVAIEPKTKADQEKMGMALSQAGAGRSHLQGADRRDSGQTIISGMGELHLEIIVDRMKREHKVEANVGEPQGGLPRDHPQEAEAEGKYIRQTGGSGNYGHCKIRIEPNEPGGLRVHQRHQGRLDSQGVHQADRSGHSGSAMERRHPGRLSEWSMSR
jgi:elongation factor G